MKKYLILGLIFYVSIDFVLDTLIENIGPNQLPKLIFFHEILHTAVKTNMIHMVKRNYTYAPKNWFNKLISKCILILRSPDLAKIKTEIDFFYYFFIQFNVPFKLISLIETSQSR